MEQAYLEQNLSYLGIDDTFIKYGTVLMPVGIINETHEPPTFYGVDRTVVEKELMLIHGGRPALCSTLVLLTDLISLHLDILV